MKPEIKKGLSFLLMILMGWTIASSTSADLGASRVRIGLKLFRTILAADSAIKEKQTKNGVLALALVYSNNSAQADLYAKKLQSSGKGKSQGKIKNIPIKVHTISANHLDDLLEQRYAGIYLVDKLNSNQLKQLIDYASRHHVIIYSPYSGDVERGVTAGIVIEARVKPYINNKMLIASKIQLSSFFIKVSKKYEP